MRRSYAGAAPVTALAAGINAGSSSFTVVTGGGSGYPTGSNGPFFVALDEETASEEKILISNRTGDVFTIAGGGRGADSTSAVAHTLPCTVRHVYTATDADEANEHVNTDAAVHGIAGNVVGDSDTQTLTNKTFDGNDNTFQNIPLSAVLFAAGWEAALGTILGANWADAFDTALGSNWTTAFANTLGATWTDALDTALGAGWPGQLSQAITSTLVQVDATQTLTNKTIDGDDNTLQDIPQSALQRAVLNLNGNGTDNSIGGPNVEEFRTTFNTADNVGGFTQGNNTAERIVPFTGLYLVTSQGRFLTNPTSEIANEEAQLRIRLNGTPGQIDGSVRTASGDAFSGQNEAWVTLTDVMTLSAGDRLKFTARNDSAQTILETGQFNEKRVSIIYLGPT